MIGTRMFSRINSRLQQIYGTKESFGGISVINVGDLNQLPPVNNKAIYKMADSLHRRR